MKPLVSVLITAYNREKYIAEAIESVLSSTFEDYELIIVDDASTDNTLSIAHEFARRDERVSVHVNEANLGDYPNRNKAASYANGELLKYVDADDIIYPTGLQVLVSMMEAHPEAGYGLCSLEQERRRPYPFQLSPTEAYRRHYFDTALFHKAPLSSIIRSHAFAAVSGFPVRRMTSDFEMWHLLSQKFPVVLMPGGVVWYREHDDQEVNDYAQYVSEYMNISIRMLTDANCPLDASESKAAMRAQRRLQARAVLRTFLKGNFRKANFLRKRLNIRPDQVLRDGLASPVKLKDAAEAGHC